MLTQTAINQVDTFFIGRLGDRTAVAGSAALGFSTILLWAFGGFLSAISVGTQALSARRYVAGDVLGAGKVLTNSLTMAVLSSAVVTGVAMLAMPSIIGFLHSDATVRDTGVAFCRIRFLGIPSMVITASLKSFYDAIGRTRVHMTVAIAMNVI